MEPESSWIPVGFVSAEPQQELQGKTLFLNRSHSQVPGVRIRMLFWGATMQPTAGWCYRHEGPAYCKNKTKPDSGI